MPKIKSQADQRRAGKFTDNHGRKWHGIVEIHTGDPTGGVYPAGWTAPLIPPPQYVRVVPGEIGQLEIAYDQWLEDLRQAHDQWLQQAQGYAVLMYGADAARAIEAPPRELEQMVGPKPMPVEPVLAAKDGNRYVLGLSDRMPEWAKPFFGPGGYFAPRAHAAWPASRLRVSDFPDAEDEELEQLEETHDPGATGGKRVPVGPPVGAGASGSGRGRARGASTDENNKED